MAKSLTISTFPNSKPQDTTAIPVVLLHGWGLNSGVWQPLIEQFNQQGDNAFQLITIDLPGFASNAEVDISPYSLEMICQKISETIKQPAIYLGWSLGGLVATQMALQFPEKVLGLITVASSPYFVEQLANEWPGIKEHVLASFHQQLSEDATKTIRGFLKIQAMGSPQIRQDLKLITELVMAHNLPSQQVLDDSLTLLSDCDLRPTLNNITQPFLRLYGQNDSLVPKAVIAEINKLSPKSESYTFAHASHAPFISHLGGFYDELSAWLHYNFCKKLI